MTDAARTPLERPTGKTGARLALALGGGAARGLAHIGVIEVLEREGLRPDCLVGSSMGGLITDTALTELLRQPILVGRHEVIATRYREKASEARLLAATHITMAARYHTWQEGDQLSPELRTAMEEHCRALAADYEDAAARYETLATSHASLTRGAAGTPSRNRSGDRQF